MGLSGFRMIYAKGLIFWGGLNFTLFSISNQVRCIYIQQTQTQRALQKPTTANKTEIKEIRYTADVEKG